MPTGAIRPEIDKVYKSQAQALVAQMTLEEKISQMVHWASEVMRLGIPAYNWWNEALHGVARAGVATVFPQAIGLAATFDPALLKKIADVISTEGRAKYDAASARGDRDIYKGLTFWSPNINIFRDPRWGRGHETYGEDPYLTAELGKAFVSGIQGEDETHLKAAACAKHFAVHSGPEDLRHEFDATCSPKDLFETYLYAFEECVVDAKVEAVMGAYNRTNGEPCCGHTFLLEEVLRRRWGFDGHVTSDCWAIKDFNEGHGVTATIEESVALAVKKGCDINCGNAYMHLAAAMDEGLIEEKDLDISLVRLMTARFRLGILGEPSKIYSGIPFTVVDSKEHHDINLEAARRCMTLLKNDGVLPLDRDKIKTLAIIGPNADNKDALLGNYTGTPNDAYTPLRGITHEAGDSVRVLYAPGCHLFKDKCSGLGQPGDRFSEALACADAADAVIVCLGLDAGLEGEQNDTGNPFMSGDKPNLDLPGLQGELLEKVLGTGKPVIVALLSGSALAVGLADDKANAVIQAWYPGALGGRALGQLIFGDYSPSGRLPVTFYRTTEELPDFTDYAMAGRTYRYMDKEALYPFGFGLSYTRFVYSNMRAPASASLGESVTVTIDVKNMGACDGWEIAQLYLTIPGEDQPKWSLKGVEPFFLEKGASKTVTFTLSKKHLTGVDDMGGAYNPAGAYVIYLGGGQPDARTAALTGVSPHSAKIMIS